MPLTVKGEGRTKSPPLAFSAPALASAFAAGLVRRTWLEALSAPNVTKALFVSRAMRAHALLDQAKPRDLPRNGVNEICNNMDMRPTGVGVRHPNRLMFDQAHCPECSLHSVGNVLARMSPAVGN